VPVQPPSERQSPSMNALRVVAGDIFVA